jgi:Co/Zn/Cd efflux system component
MSGCCGNDYSDAPVEQGARKALWIALIINAGMFVVELSAGLAGGSAGLQADAMDFMGDAAGYGISLAVLSMAAVWRTRAAMLKGATMLLFGLWVAGTIVYHWQNGTVPSYELMGGIGLAAMAANIVCAVILFRFRGTDANMRSVWLCTRNDVLSNIAIVIAASGVWASGSGLPDLIVAAIIAGLAITGATDVLKRVRQEFRDLAPAGGD